MLGLTTHRRGYGFESSTVQSKNSRETTGRAPIECQKLRAETLATRGVSSLKNLCYLTPLHTVHSKMLFCPYIAVNILVLVEVRMNFADIFSKTGKHNCNFFFFFFFLGGGVLLKSGYLNLKFAF